MKLRYFYLLCFLVSIKSSFCYECINNDKVMRPNDSIKRNGKSKHGIQKLQHHRSRRQEYEEEKDPVASIDIASFIQQPDPDYEAVEDPKQYKNRRRASRYYDDFESLKEMEMSLENKANDLRNDLEELENSNILYGHKMTNPDKFAKNDFAADVLHHDSIAKTEEKLKIPRRRKAIPFFSRNNKTKKHKKRKLFCFGTKRTSTTTLLPKSDAPKPNLKNQYNKVKRSNFDRFCPLCKRKLLPKSKKEKYKAPLKNVHNSRQYYQNFGDVGQKKQKKAISSNEFRSNKLGKREKRDYYEGAEVYDTRRSQHSKRGDVPNDNKERQLKELESIQRKVDSVEVNVPHDFSKQNNNNNG